MEKLAIRNQKNLAIKTRPTVLYVWMRYSYFQISGSSCMAWPMHCHSRKFGLGCVSLYPCSFISFPHLLRPFDRVSISTPLIPSLSLIPFLFLIGSLSLLLRLLLSHFLLSFGFCFIPYLLPAGYGQSSLSCEAVHSLQLV